MEEDRGEVSSSSVGGGGSQWERFIHSFTHSCIPSSIHLITFIHKLSQPPNHLTIHPHTHSTKFQQSWKLGIQH